MSRGKEASRCVLCAGNDRSWILSEHNGWRGGWEPVGGYTEVLSKDSALGLVYRCFFLFLINISDFWLNQSLHLSHVIFPRVVVAVCGKSLASFSGALAPTLQSHGVPPGGAFFLYDLVSYPQTRQPWSPDPRTWLIWGRHRSQGSPSLQVCTGGRDGAPLHVWEPETVPTLLVRS